MSLTNDDKLLLSRLHIDKAHVCLHDAEQLLAAGSVSSAANRLYYAVFHAIHALFVAHGIYSKSHHGANAQFNQHFIKTGVLDSRFGRFVAVMENLREKADYDIVYDITYEELNELKPTAIDLIRQIEELLSTATQG